MQKTAEMKPKILVPNSSGVTAVKAFQLAKAEGLTLISNKRADKILRSGEWKSVRAAWPIHTGTMAAYTNPGAKFGATVEYRDLASGITWIFEVPTGTGLRGLKDALLAVEHPDYDLEVEKAKKRIIVHPRKELIVPVESFPSVSTSEGGWYATDPKTAIPVDRPFSLHKYNIRCLYRLPRGVGLVVRGYDSGYRHNPHAHVVDLDCELSDRLGVLALDKVSEQIKAETGQ